MLLPLLMRVKRTLTFLLQLKMLIYACWVATMIELLLNKESLDIYRMLLEC